MGKAGCNRAALSSHTFQVHALAMRQGGSSEVFRASRRGREVALKAQNEAKQGPDPRSAAKGDDFRREPGGAGACTDSFNSFLVLLASFAHFAFQKRPFAIRLGRSFEEKWRA